MPCIQNWPQGGRLLGVNIGRSITTRRASTASGAKATTGKQQPTTQHKPPAALLESNNELAGWFGLVGVWGDVPTDAAW